MLDSEQTQNKGQMHLCQTTRPITKFGTLSVFCGNGIEKAPFDNYFIVIRYIGEGGIANLGFVPNLVKTKIVSSSELSMH